MIWDSNIIAKFAKADRRKPRSGNWGWDAVIALARSCCANGKPISLGKDIIESVYPRWFLNTWNSRKISITVKDWATMDARGYVIILHSARYSARDIAGCTNCIYKRRASSLPSNCNRAMREASSGRMQPIQTPTLFSYSKKRQREDDRGSNGPQWKGSVEI